MSDEDLRRGFRAMISGGLSGLDTESVNKLSTEIANVQRERGETPSVDEVQYLQEYVKLSETHIDESISSGYFDSAGAQTQLQVLNDKFPNISESVRKTSVISPNAGNTLENEGWMSSSYQC